MIKNIAWNVFKNTGNIDAFLEFQQIKDIENNSITNNASIIQKVELNGDDKNQWNNNF